MFQQVVMFPRLSHNWYSNIIYKIRFQSRYANEVILRIFSVDEKIEGTGFLLARVAF